MRSRKTIKYIAIKEFRKAGYLQEVNRRFFHPLGLALEVIREADGTETLSGIWDYRDDPEGIYFGENDLAAKAEAIDSLWKTREPARLAALGFVVQPTKTPEERDV